MGFYGKIYEQAVDIFNRLRFKNTTEDAFPEDLLVNEFTLRADGGEAAATISAGNQWIQFTQADDLSCKIYHKKSDIPEGIKETFIVDQDPDLVIDNEIIFNDVITIYYPVTDATGHIVNYEEKKYRMMTDVGELNDRIEALSNRITDTENTANAASSAAHDAVKLANEAVTIAQDAVDAVISAKDAAKTAIQAANEATQAAQDANTALSSLQEQDIVFLNDINDIKKDIVAIKQRLGIE